MERKIKISAAGVEVAAVLNGSKTADAIWQALPITGRGNRWGDEIYFGIAVKLGSEDGRAVVEEGDLGYWPPGSAFCIFFGPTPASVGNEPRAASPVNVFGKIAGDPKVLAAVRDGAAIKIEQAK